MMLPEEYKRQDIEVLNEVEPYCFKSDREEQWFKVGLQYGLDAADKEPLIHWISVNDDLPCNHEELLEDYGGELLKDYGYETVAVIIKSKYSKSPSTDFMRRLDKGNWVWMRNLAITHWMPFPEPPKE